MERRNIIAEAVQSSDVSPRFVIPELSLLESILCRPATIKEIIDEVNDAIVSRLNQPDDPARKIFFLWIG